MATHSAHLQFQLLPFAQAEAAFLEAYPSYQETAVLDRLRQSDYGRLDAQGHIYLDYTGGGLYAESQLEAHMKMLRENVFGNPHSHNPTSLAMTKLVEQARAYVLTYFNAPADEYTVIFTPNASGALKLVGESYPFTTNSHFALSADDHNSVNGIREFARARGAKVTYVPVVAPELRLDMEKLEDTLNMANPDGHNLFAFPAQSNYSGVKHPLTLIEKARSKGWDVLVDGAAFAPTNRFDFAKWRPDFATFSFYKIFGYPTGLGALVVRREMLAKLQRPWFAGGTVKIVSVKAGRHFLEDGEAGFEDGTVNYLMIPAVEIGLRHIDRIGIETIGERVRCLTGWLLDTVTQLRHSNGQPMVEIHGPENLEMRGGTISLTVYDAEGRPFSGQVLEKLAGDAKISIRTGCFCNPGAGESAFNLPKSLMQSLFERGSGIHFIELVQIIYDARGVDVSAVRVSLGMVSNFADVYRFMSFLLGFRDKKVNDFAETAVLGAYLNRDTP